MQSKVARVLTVNLIGETVAYPDDLLQEVQVVGDTVGRGKPAHNGFLGCGNGLCPGCRLSRRGRTAVWVCL